MATINAEEPRRHTGIRYRSAASTAVMRSGRHFAQFTVLAGTWIFFGVLRPGWDVERGDSAMDVCNDAGHCFFCTYDGHRYPDNMQDWEGAWVHSEHPGDRVGML
eukprot:COSAG06_NODE_25859_length_627_cov_1.017045_1_plen_104_part_10